MASLPVVLAQYQLLRQSKRPYRQSVDVAYAALRSQLKHGAVWCWDIWGNYGGSMMVNDG